MNSGGRLAISPNDGTLLVDVDMDEDASRKDWDGPPPAIWSVDLSKGLATRLTPKGTFAWEPCWVTSDAFLCLIQPASAKEPSIYRMSADGKTRQALVKNARDHSVSR
jgi:TolB protein